jgi:hypothetical protein
MITAVDLSPSYLYPSPSTGDTATISYGLGSPSHVIIRIYNETGRLVDSIEEDRGAGRQTTSVSVGRFAVGIYFYLLSSRSPGSPDVNEGARKFAVLH